MPDYIDVDALTSPSFYYDGNNHIVVEDTTAYNPFTGLLDLDQIANPTPETPSYAYNIYIGSLDTPTYLFGEEDLLSVNTNTSLDPIGNELSIDTLEFEVYSTDTALQNLAYATPIWCYRGGYFVGKFYYKSTERYGTKHYKISAVSLIGLLEYEPHYGGMYQAMSAKGAIKEAILSNGLGTERFIGREYATTNTSPVTSLPLANNYVDTNVTKSSTRSAIDITFSVNSATYNSVQPVWLNVIDEYPNSSTMPDTYICGISVKKKTNTSSDTTITVTVYCGYGDYNTVSTPVGTFDSTYGTKIRIQIVPYYGRYRVWLNDSDTYTETTFTSFSDNYRVPIYSTCGVTYSSETLTPVTTTLGYNLYSLKILYYTGNASAYCDIAVLQDIFTEEAYFINTKTDYLVKAEGYVVGGEEVTYTGTGSAANLESENPDLYDAVQNILWADAIDNMTVNGWIAASTKREVLHQLLFALNLNLFKAEDGNLVINKLPPEIVKEIGEEEIYAKGSTEPVKQPKYIELTEHSYTATGQTETVFDNSDATVSSGNYIVLFDNPPIYGTPTAGSGITIIAYNANAAIVSGKGAITAQTYLHSQRVLKQLVGSRPDGSTVSVSDATLVTFINSSNIMDKLLAYYGNSVYKVKNSTIASGCLCGRNYQFVDPFGDDDTGYLVEANSKASAVTKTDCVFVSGYTPVGIGGEYSNFVMLTGSGTFSLPEGATKLHVVMVGGGTGGSSGYAGANGGANTNFNSSSAAQGGNYGANGGGGKIYEVDITSPSASYSYACGTGGAGGAESTSTNENNAGSAGTASTFGTYSSASGSATGYTNIMNGDMFGLTMPTWNSESGKGGNGGYKTVNDSSNPTQVTQGEAESAYNFLTGLTYSRGVSILGGAVNGVYQWLGGSGGGAALTKNGGRGGDYGGSIGGGSPQINAVGGNGADATYVPPKATDYNPKYYGYGGMGGCGGGGGGSAGYDGGEQQSFSGGTGGYGGKGGDGGDGCIIVFY